MDIKDLKEASGFFSIDLSDEKKFHESVDATVDSAIQIVGPRRALEAAMLAHHKELHEFFGAINAVAAHQKTRATPIMPLTSDVLDQFNRCVATTALVAGFMSKGVLEMENKKALVN